MQSAFLREKKYTCQPGVAALDTESLHPKLGRVSVLNQELFALGVNVFALLRMIAVCRAGGGLRFPGHTLHFERLKAAAAAVLAETDGCIAGIRVGTRIRPGAGLRFSAVVVHERALFGTRYGCGNARSDRQPHRPLMLPGTRVRFFAAPLRFSGV